MGLKIEVLLDLGRQGKQATGADLVAAALEYLAGAAHAAHVVVLFQHQHPAPIACQYQAAGQAIVARSH